MKALLAQLREEHHQARHFCYAYLSPPAENESRFSDDGEPSHTAGTPILNSIQSSGLHNILVVVVRYFGGTKLGRPGLVNAYKTAAAMSLEKAEKRIITPMALISLSFPYQRMQEIQIILNRTGIKPEKIEMTAAVSMKLNIELSEIPNWEIYLQSIPELIFEISN